MKLPVLKLALLLGALTLSPLIINAQGGSSAAYWFRVHGSVLLLESAAGSKPVSSAVSLPNGTRLDYRTATATLPDGTQQPLHEGDMVSLNGTITLAPPPPAPASPPANDALAASPVSTATAAAAAPPLSAPLTKAAVAGPAAPSRFTYNPPAPVGGRLKGVVELGASGFNSFIINVDARKRWQLRKAEFGNSLVMENLATDDDVRLGLKAYIGKMLDYGVGGRDIYFVVSSGALKAAITQRIIKSLKALGYVVNTVTPEREGGLALRAVLPPDYNERAFVVDMGSANTKIAWLINGQSTALETYGAKYYEAGTSDATVAAAVKVKVQQVPAALRGTCFVLGGVPFELAKKVRQGKERYTVLDAPSAYASASGAKLNAGLNIYQALVEATGCQTFVFDWDANFTIGHLLSLP